MIAISLEPLYLLLVLHRIRRSLPLEAYNFVVLLKNEKVTLKLGNQCNFVILFVCTQLYTYMRCPLCCYLLSDMYLIGTGCQE